MANKISVLIDIATDKAVGGLKSFRQSITDADGSVGKFKAGASSAFDSIKANAGNLALVAGTALVTFGVKAVTAFTNTAVSAGKFADATGLSTEAASKWVAVGDDIGISAETMEKSFGKLAVSIGKNNPLLEEYGITVKKGADGQDDMNATMLNAIDVINGIQDPTKKAAVAQAALGKGWMDMAELIGQGSDELTESMAKVSEAQVIDPEEVEKARKMRESMDNLQDSVRDVALVMGEDLVPAATAVAEVLVMIIKPLSELNQWTKKVATSFFEMIGVFEKAPKVADDAAAGVGRMATALDAAATSGTTVEDVMAALKLAIEAGNEATADAVENTDDARKRHDEWHDSIMAVTDAYRALKGELSAEEAFHNAEAMWADLQESAVAAYDAAATGAEDAEQKAFDHAGAVIDAKQKVVELGEQYADLPEEEVTRIVALIDEGKLAEAEAAFNNLTRTRTMNVSIQANGGIGFGVGARASGGPVSAGGTYWVGEDGPELLTMGGSNGHITPNGALAGGSLTVNINGGLIDQRTIEQLAREWDRWKRGMS